LLKAGLILITQIFELDMEIKIVQTTGKANYLVSYFYEVISVFGVRNITSMMRFSICRLKF